MLTTPRTMSRYARAAVPLMLLAAGAAGCGDDDRGATAERAEVLTVTAADYRFENVPTEVPAGTTFTLRNRSTGEAHEVVAMRLSDTEVRPLQQLAALPESELGALVAGPPSFVLVAAPGEAGFAALGDGTLAEPGRYLLACFIPTGAAPDAYLGALKANPGQPPSVPGGPPHLAAGMVGEITVR